MRNNYLYGSELEYRPVQCSFVAEDNKPSRASNAGNVTVWIQSSLCNLWCQAVFEQTLFVVPDAGLTE